VRVVERREEDQQDSEFWNHPSRNKTLASEALSKKAGKTMSDGEDMEIEIEGMDVCRSTSLAESAVSDDRSDSGSCKNYDSEDQVDVDESIPLDHDFLRRKRLLGSIPDKPKQAAWIDTLIRLEKLDNVSVEITESNPFDVLVCIFDADGELRGSFKWWDVPAPPIHPFPFVLCSRPVRFTDSRDSTAYDDRSVPSGYGWKADDLIFPHAPPTLEFIGPKLDFATLLQVILWPDIQVIVLLSHVLRRVPATCSAHSRRACMRQRSSLIAGGPVESVHRPS
jgi:hypothetical protein